MQRTCIKNNLSDSIFSMLFFFLVSYTNIDMLFLLADPLKLQIFCQLLEIILGARRHGRGSHSNLSDVAPPELFYITTFLG